MVPNEAVRLNRQFATSTSSLPALTHRSSLASEATSNATHGSARLLDRSLLTPHDALYQASSPPAARRQTLRLQQELRMTSGARNDNSSSTATRRRSRHRDAEGPDRSRSRRRKGAWKKLLWVKQSYPDNYTDQETFLEHLQRNPRFQPYDFWPLVADSTVIVQHVCSVAIFVVCFVGIFQERMSPESIVGGGTFVTVLGWVVWDRWVGQDESVYASPISHPSAAAASGISAASSTTALHPSVSQIGLTPKPSRSASALSITSPALPSADVAHLARFRDTRSMSHKQSHRLSTAKSAILIYFTLLGMSPILKSLTRSTSSDSIWAMSFFLFTINIFFFDYGSRAPPPGEQRPTHDRSAAAVNAASTFPSDSTSATATAATAMPMTTGTSTKNINIPASLSTNAALMASTVLASRLPSTGQVFSLTLFSIEVFGLFPIFRRYARERSVRGHVALTVLLVIGAGAGVGAILGGGAATPTTPPPPLLGTSHPHHPWPWKAGLIGVVVNLLGTGLAMGGASWWLISLQKYKNEIHGPWDPARPVLRRRWDDY